MASGVISCSQTRFAAMFLNIEMLGGQAARQRT
jgi:hypothetical protein